MLRASESVIGMGQNTPLASFMSVTEARQSSCPMKPVEGRVSSHAEHEKVGNFTRRDRDFLQSLGPPEDLAPVRDQNEQGLERATPVRRY